MVGRRGCNYNPDIQLVNDAPHDYWLAAMEPVDYVQCWPGAWLAATDLMPVFEWPAGNDSPGDPNDQGWTTHDLTGAGDYAWIWDNLADAYASGENYTPQIAFIDDGNKVPGTGGSQCINWCYGPGGYVVNTGYPGSRPSYVHNEVWSPEIDWPVGAYDGAVFSFDVFRHERLVAGENSPGVLYLWRVRSAVDNGSGEEWSEWRDRGYAYYGPEGHRRVQLDVSDLLLQGRTKVQLSLGVAHLGWTMGLDGHDATPAPYFDNVALHVYEHEGPAIYARAIDLAQDAFADAAGDVPFDAARNEARPEEMVNRPADGITVQVRPMGVDATLAGPPELHYYLRANPHLGGTDQQGVVTGVQLPVSTKAGWALLEDEWTFYLPDVSFMAAGDILHYYIKAEDNHGVVSTLPADLRGYDLFPDDPSFRWYEAYPDLFTVICLPTIRSATPGDHPPILLWLDLRGSGNENHWISDLSQLGFVRGVDFDVYYTNGPSFGVGNGLGGRASAQDLAGYDTIIYDSGELHRHTLGNGDFGGDPSDDIGLLDQWLNQGNKNLVLFGDHLVDDLMRTPQGAAFASGWIGVDLVEPDVMPLVHGQTSPLAVVMAGNSVFREDFRWRVFRGWRTDPARPSENHTFDAVVALPGTEKLMEWYDPDCQSGQYPFAAATLNDDPAGQQNRIIYLPYGYTHLLGGEPAATSCGNDGTTTVTVRGTGLLDILWATGHGGSGLPAPVPEVPEEFGASCYPTPFNPQTTIFYTLPEAGDLRIRIYNLRGELVATLLDEQAPAGAGSVTWRGTDRGGARVASGIYFYEVRHGGEAVRDKIMLVK
jgi:hypothetical protein